MKIGNSRQAIGLGAVAIVTVGFCAKTAFASFSGGVSKPLQVVELRGGRAPSTTKTHDEPTQAATAPTSNTTSAPATTQTTQTPASTVPGMVPDVFANHFSVQSHGPSPVAPQSKPKSHLSGKLPDTTRPDDSSDTTPPNFENGEVKGEIGGLGPAKPSMGKGDSNSNDHGPTDQKSQPTTLRFDGFVDAGTPMAVVTYKGSSYTVSAGEILPDGLKVIGITSDKMTVRKGQIARTIFIGKETDFR